MTRFKGLLSAVREVGLSPAGLAPLAYAVPGVAILAAVAALCAAPAAQAEFGVSRFAISARNQDGTPDVQAGSHPYALNTTIVLNEPGPTSGNLKDVTLQLPPGLVGNPDATPKCTYQEFIRQVEGGAREFGRCPNETVVGLASFYLQNPNQPTEFLPSSAAVYNLVPPAGVAAEFAYVAIRHTPILLQESVRSGRDYGVTTTVPDINEQSNIYASKVTIWGTPADPAHNHWRGTCLLVEGGGRHSVEEGAGLAEGEDELEGPLYENGGGGRGLPESNGEICATGDAVQPLLTMPTSCGRPLSASAAVDSWQEPGDFTGAEGQRTRTASLPELTGCENLPFDPELSVTPEKRTGSTSSGVNVGVTVPQGSTESSDGLAEADVKDTTLTFPAGFELNASAANGLQGCSTAQIGYTGSAELDPATEPGVQPPQLEERLQNPATGRPEADLCPDASKLANVQIKSPLLEGKLLGAIYLAAPQNFSTGPLENPFKSLTAVYGVAEEARTGVLVKFAGSLERNLETGQLTGKLENTPQLPFSEANLEFFGGERAAFATPSQCGGYESTATLAPWSATAPVKPTSDFKITSGPSGSACPSGALPFTPTLQAGTTNTNAGAFSELSTQINREDGQQAIQNVTLTYPPGVSAVLAGVPQCAEAQANAGTCPAETQIGEDMASVGVGSDPYTVTGGRVYLTGPYGGAPFGLSIVTPTKAGPFIPDEGAPVVTRAKIEVNPTTAQVTVTTTGEIPHILDGFELNVKQINVSINRPGFTINPTSCEPMSVAGTIAGLEGAAAPVTMRFQMGNCQNLKFAPKFSASTAAHTSRSQGASLVTTIEEPAGALGTQADIAKVKVQLPKQLPSELRTLQKACLAKTFEASPEACLAESPHAKVGEAVVHTPLLPVPLTGNAYLVSHGGAEFPDLTLVLKGDDVTIVLVGSTNITNGITTTTFKTTPDVPFTSFQLALPQGEYSALGSYLATGNKASFCGRSLVMPTEIVAQNGMALYQNTTISVTGCPPAVSVTKTKIKGNSLVVTVKLGQTGTLVLSAKGIRRKTVRGAKAGIRTITIPLTATGRAAARHRAKIKITVALTAAGHTGTATSTVRA